MVDVKYYITSLCQRLDDAFGGRVLCVGLQGSYGRDEASPHSDIDAVVVLDRLTADDLQVYDAILDELPYRSLACGFISGREELTHWDTAELFQFYHDTTPVAGSLDFLLPALDEYAPRRAMLTGACAVYHACVHNLLHEKDPEILKGLYKSAVFTVQAVHFCRTGQYIRRHRDLLAAVSEPEHHVLLTALTLKTGQDIEPEEFVPLSNELFHWAQQLIEKEGLSNG